MKSNMKFGYGDRVEYTQTDGQLVTGSIGAPAGDPYAVKVYRDDAPGQPGTWIGREFVRKSA